MNRNIRGKIIGISGKCCSGKNEAAEVLCRGGWHIIDVDKVGHRALEAEKSSLTRLFGEEVLGADGHVDRRALGSIVFGDKKKLCMLESLVHPVMEEMVKTEAEKQAVSGCNVCINAALLFTMGLYTLCGHVLMVEAPYCVRARRARRRDGWGYPQIIRRFAAQRRLFPKKLTKNVDMYTVENSADRNMMRSKIEEFLKLIERQG